MKKAMNRVDSIKYFILGVFMFFVFCILTGSKEFPHVQYGRYQIAAWGTTFGDLTGAYGAFILDTVTGETKIAYRYVYTDSNTTSVYTNNLGRPFALIE